MSLPSPVAAELKKFEDAKHRAARSHYADRNLEVVKPSTNGSHFSISSLEDLQANPPEPEEWIWQDILIRGGISAAVAPPKVCKTTFACNLAARFSTGGSYGGREVKQTSVLYLAMEEKASQMIARIGKLGGDPKKIFIHNGPAPGATLVEAIAALKNGVLEINPGIVFIDPLSRLARIADYSSYGEVTKAFELIIDLARTTGTHNMVIHHARKGENQSEDCVLGSQGIFGAVDTLILFSKKRDSGKRTIRTVQRHGIDMPETLLTFEDGRLDIGDDLDSFNFRERQKAVLEVLSSEPITEPEIKELCGGTNAGLTSRAIRALFDEGKLTRTGRGRKGDPFAYSLPALRELPDEIYIPPGATDAEIEAICGS